MTPSMLCLIGIVGMLSYAFGGMFEQDNKKYWICLWLAGGGNLLLIITGAIWGVFF